MKRQGTIGLGAAFAVVAAAGMFLQTGSRQEFSRPGDQSVAGRPEPAARKRQASEKRPGCDGVKSQLEEFLKIQIPVLPSSCYESRETSPQTAYPAKAVKSDTNLKFVIAILPDPVHTHLSALFDQFITAIQEGAQDERYDFDSSWLPWEGQEEPYPLLIDQKIAGRDKEWKEGQPGVILFRKNTDRPLDAYRSGLIVFVVGDEATHGIHRDQFRNALDWISTLRANGHEGRVAILGPTFSGSLPSLEVVLQEQSIAKQLGLADGQAREPLPIYSGSVSGASAAGTFQKNFATQISFHSFVESDDTNLDRFCSYMQAEQPQFDAWKVAVISEDETAYGSSGIAKQEGQGKKTECPDHALRLFYPRDISALRGAYQTRSIFDGATPSRPADPQRRNLPTDLADPAGNVHDSIRSYGGNQTPLSQEAFLLNIVTALHDFHARYILLRSSNALDQLFLTNFLRRSYPDGRIVIFGADLLFVRERGATGLGGTMLLSNYPLFPLARDWAEYKSLPAAERMFSSDTSEGTYIALRLLLNSKRLTEEQGGTYRCHVMKEQAPRIFLPPVACASDPPIPDYSPPRWVLSNHCGDKHNGELCKYPGPPTWISVIGMNRLWPVASLIGQIQDAENANPGSLDPRESENASRTADQPGQNPEMPAAMKVLLLCLSAFSIFHAWCCWAGSYTAKPAFRAHFASAGDWRHTTLILAGSCFVAFLAITAGWASGVFSSVAGTEAYSGWALAPVAFTCLMAWLALVLHSFTSWKLVLQQPVLAPRAKSIAIWLGSLASVLLVVCTGAFYRLLIHPLEGFLTPENGVLTHWRAMHLTSSVSPLLPMFFLLTGLYASFWLALHGLALLGPDRPYLPPREKLKIKIPQKGETEYFRMFSQEDAAKKIEQPAEPLNWQVALITLSLFFLFRIITWRLAKGVPIRSLGAEAYSVTFLYWLGFSYCLMLAETWRLYDLWEELRRLLTFLDRVPLRRTLAVLHGFSWESVWKMSGNVLEVRYKVISRQLECMNHTIASLEDFIATKFLGADWVDPDEVKVAQECRLALVGVQNKGRTFADWYSASFTEPRAGNLTSFEDFQTSIAAATGTLLTRLLVTAWRNETSSLIVAPIEDHDPNEERKQKAPPQSKNEHIRNAEEFVCLTYLGFVQNMLGRLRTIAMTIAALFVAATVALSTYPFDPRQTLSLVLVILFVAVGGVIVKVYAQMHRDTTLSHVTNTKPGELGAEFWIKILGFGFAPLLGLLSRIIPGIGDFLFSWLQPGISALK